MRPRTPRWWYARRAPGAAILLQPFGGLWAWATARRLRRGVPVDAGAPVICVGNLTVGGSGKTPVAIALARLLTAAGAQPHLLSRGHGGRARGPLRIEPERHDADDVGDEALLLAAAAPTWIARDRAAGALAAVTGGAGMIIVDDGHQSPALIKALSIVVVDGETRAGEWPFGAGGVVPAGPLREPLTTGLARADLVIVLLPADVDRPDPELLALFAGKPVHIARLQAPPPPTGPQLAFAGIGKPWKMRRALEAAGCDLVDFVALADHARLGAPALDSLARRAAARGAGLLTSEKDWVRLPAPWRDRVAPWPVRVAFDNPAELVARLTAPPR